MNVTQNDKKYGIHMKRFMLTHRCETKNTGSLTSRSSLIYILGKKMIMKKLDKQRLDELLFAAQESSISGVQQMLLDGLSVNSTNENGVTPLMRASAYGKDEMVRFLIERGAKLDARDKDGWDAFLMTSINGKTAVARILLEHGLDVNSKNSGGNNALMIAAAEGHKEYAIFLLNSGIDKYAKNKDLLTALDIAKNENQYLMIDLLDSEID